MSDTFKPPEAAVNAAKRVLAWKEEYGDEVKAMTSTGWARANQLASGQGVSLDVVRRMAAFARHRKNADVDPKYKDEPWKDNGHVAWLGWGGTAGIDWAIRTSEANKSLGDDPVHKGRRIMKEFSIFEISGVDQPAQAPALMTLMKSRVQGGQIAGEPGAGHTKEDTMSKTAEELQAELAKSAETQKKLQADLELAQAIAKMSDAEKAAMDDMGEEEKAKFVASKPEDRKKEVAKRADSNPVIYKSKSTGAEYRKSDDARLIDLAKRDDDREVELAKMREAAVDEAFEKRAAVELARLPGDKVAKTALMKAIAGIKDETVRKSVSDMMKSAQDRLGVMLKEIGTSNDDTSGDDADQDIKKAAENSLDKMAKDYMAKNTGVSYAKAYDAVLQTAEGAAIYAKSA